MPPVFCPALSTPSRCEQSFHTVTLLQEREPQSLHLSDVLTLSFITCYLLMP